MTKNRAPSRHNIAGNAIVNSPGYKLEIQKGLTTTAALLLSVSATVAANSGEHSPSSDPEFSYSEQINGCTSTVQEDFGLHDVIPGEGDLPLPGARFDVILQNPVTPIELDGDGIPVTSEIQQHETILDELQLMEWARLFDKDPAVVHTLDRELGIKDTVAQIEQLIADGWMIESIKLHGHASDEDDTAWKNGGTNPGFGVYSKKNVKLAVKRAKAVEELLEARLAKSKIASQQTGSVVVTGGTELDDPVLAAEITDLAAKRGSTAQDIVVRYNRDRDSFSGSDLEVLDGLRDDRYVSIEIDVSRLETVTTHHTDESGNVTESKETKKHVSIVLIPIIIPFIKKRRIVPGVKRLGSPMYPGKTIIPNDRSDRTAQGRTVEPWRPHKQPGQLNDGRNSGTRGQSGAYPTSRNNRNKTKGLR